MRSEITGNALRAFPALLHCILIIMHTTDSVREKPLALSLLASERPRNVGWKQAAGLLFGDWGTSRLYVLGIALLFAGRTSF